MSAFAEFAQLEEQLAATRAHKAMSALVAHYLRSVAEDEIAPAALMVIGRVFPERGGRPLNLSGAAVMSVVHQVVKTTAEQRERIAGETVDFEQSVQRFTPRQCWIRTQRCKARPAHQAHVSPDCCLGCGSL